MKEQGSYLWKWIMEKHVVEGMRWFSELLRRLHELEMWKRIRMERGDFQGCIGWRVGQGRECNYGGMTGCEGGPYPRYSIFMQLFEMR